MHDVLVVGAGPAGRAIAAACAERGLATRVLDPAPGRPWRATYGAWSDELPADLPAGVIAARARGVAVAHTRHVLGREYAVLDVPGLRAHLDGRLAAARVLVERGRGDPGRLPPARVVVDAGGAQQPLSRHQSRGRDRRPRPAAQQTAFGLMLPVEMASPLLAEGDAVFMDWRPVAPTEAGGDATFLYAVPLGAGRVLLEETSLARRPGLPVAVLADRLAARLAAHGIRPPPDAEREIVRFALDVPRHRASGVLGFGAAAPLTHPATGYQIATALRTAPLVADALAAHWDDDPLRAARATLWPPAAQATHLLRRRGLECLLRMPANRMPEFFEGFFALGSDARDAYLGGRTRPLATAAAMAGMFHTTSWPVRRRLIGSFLLPGAIRHSSERSSLE